MLFPCFFSSHCTIIDRGLHTCVEEGGQQQDVRALHLPLPVRQAPPRYVVFCVFLCLYVEMYVLFSRKIVLLGAVYLARSFARGHAKTSSAINILIYLCLISPHMYYTGWFLGTVDVRKGAELEAESSLKFFEWSDLQAKYRLGAQVCVCDVCML